MADFPALVLAAGAARRFGAPKPLAKLAGTRLVRRVVRTALDAGFRPWVVIGAEAAALRAELADLPVAFIDNPDWQQGMASSLRAGLGAVQPLAPAAVAILLADQPLIEVDDLRRLRALAEAQPGSLVASVGEGAPEPGPPSCFPRHCFAELMTLQGDQGGRAVLRRHRASLQLLDLGSRILDVDTPQDLARAEAVLNAADRRPR